MFSEVIAQRGINSEFDSLIQSAASKYGIAVPLIKAIISTESAWNPDAVNPNDPSYGLMQLNFTYWKTANGQPIIDPAENIDVGTSYLATQSRQYGPNLESIISAYNAGHPISSNQQYVDEVMQYYQWFLANDQGGGGVVPWGTSDSDLKLVAGVVVGLMLVYFLIRR